MNDKLNKLKRIWNSYGKNDPYWSVLTLDEYKSSSLKKNYDKFFDTGKKHIADLENILQRHNSTFKDKVILDFGCGVGRLTKSCTDYSLKVYGMDISEEHLKIAKRNVKSASFYCVESENNLPKLPINPEIIISLITLQHSEPKLIKKYLISLLKILQMNGISCIHIPYKINSYHVNSSDKMQMHSLSKDDVKKIVHFSNCKILEEIDSDLTDKRNGIFSAIYVIKKSL